MADPTQDVQTDFYADLVEAACAELQRAGYAVPGAMVQERIVYAYFNALKRSIAPRSRTILEAKELICPAEHQPGLTALKARIVRGDDLTAHLSKRIQDVEYGDPLLNDWGIHHLHLGITADASGFVARTGPVLFARFETETAFLLTVYGHGNWSNQEMIDILLRNWPDRFDRFRMPGAGGGVSPTNEEIAQARKAGVQALLPRPGGAVFPMGGGYATDGTSNDALSSHDRVADVAQAYERAVRAQVEDIRKAASTKGKVLPTPLTLKYRIDPTGTAFAVEPTTDTAVLLGPSGFGGR